MNSDIITVELSILQKHFVSAGFDLRLVGGCVRDLVAGHDPKDIDLCTDADPNEQIEIYNRHGYKFVPTGIDHGTITVVVSRVTYEITSLRLDVATDGRRATVAYTRDWLEDLERRDFTFNAMSMTFNGELIDPFNGVQDLQEGQVRFVGNPEQRIQEDYLRILRWFRFRARFGTGSHWDSPAWDAIRKHMPGLERISTERIWSEIKAIVRTDAGADMLADICRTGIHRHIRMPYPGTNGGAKSVMSAKLWSNDPEILMAAFFGWKVGDIFDVANNWKWSRAELDHVMWLIKHGWSNRDLRKLIAVDGAPRNWVRELAMWEERDPWEVNALAEWVFPPFPVSGNDLKELGIKPGPEMGKILKKLKDQWADSGYTAGRHDLLATAKSHYTNDF